MVRVGPFVCVTVIAMSSTHAARPSSADVGLFFARPAALPTGLSSGVGIGAVWEGTLGLTVGGRASISTATEYTLTHEVTHTDTRLLLDTRLMHDVGPGALGVRLGVGGTAVHESGKRNQADRAGDTGVVTESTAWNLVPGAELAAVTSIRLLGDWGVVLTGGPAWHQLDGGRTLGFMAELGVAWQP